MSARVRRLLTALDARLARWLGPVAEPALIASAPARHARALARLRGRPRYRVAFLAVHYAAWKCEGVYRAMVDDPLFDPEVVVCPYTLGGAMELWRELHHTLACFRRDGYRVQSAWDRAAGRWLDVERDLRPDLVFLTNPHPLTRVAYQATAFPGVLTGYVPYGIMAANIQPLQYDQLFHNLIWRQFCETPLHADMAARYARNRGRNVVVTGYPMTDVLLDTAHVPRDVWSVPDPAVRRLIWAPHHTLERDDRVLGYASFLADHAAMLDLPDRWPGRLQVAFKPHPLLRSKLHAHPGWGPARTEAYYRAWQERPLRQLEEGDYVDLFLTSDAMVFDSISFVTEYAYTGKPSCFRVRDPSVRSKWNEFGAQAFGLLYHADDLPTVHRFVERTVLGGEDPRREERLAFRRDVLTPPHGRTATQNILDHLRRELGHEVRL